MHWLIDKARQAPAQLLYLPRAFALVWSSAQRWTIAWAALLVLNGLLPAATVYLSRPLVDSLVLAAGSHGDWPNVRWTLILAVGMLGVMLLTELLQSFAEWVRTSQA